MRSEGPALLPIFRSHHQARILTWLLLHPHAESTVTDMARRLDLPLTTAHREIRRLIDAGLLRSRPVGRSLLVSADPDHRALEALTRLLEVTYGPDVVINEEFASLDGADLIVIFGSWAARFRGETGPPPGDVDVLVVGSPTRSAVYEAADRAQERLDIPVNPVIRSLEQWEAATDPLVRQIHASPHVVMPVSTAAIKPDEGGDDEPR